VVVVIGYGVAFYFLSLTLKTLPVGIAYAVWSGLGVVLVSLVGLIFLGQSIDIAGAVGIGLIVAGVAVLNLFSTLTPH
jgi:small multidrug resistance pump